MRRGDAGRALRRRDLIALFGGTAVGWPLTAGAQRKAMLVIGALNSTSPGGQLAPLLAAFHQGLGETGYVEGQSWRYRWAEGHYDRLPALAAELAAIDPRPGR